MAETTIIDVSEHNGTLDWERLQESVKSRGELTGVIMRAGYGTATGLQKDAQFDRNRQQAIQRGIPHMIYVYAYPGRSSGIVQANGLARIVGQLQPGESIALDLEDDFTFGRGIVANDVNWAVDFCNQVKQLLGITPLSYMNSNLLSRFDWLPLVRAGSKLWLANYGVNNGRPNMPPNAQEWGAWSIWQYTSHGNIAGISPVDVNLFAGNIADFNALGAGGTIPTPVILASAHVPVGGNGTSYSVGRPVNGYINARDAANRQNSNSSVPPGTYYVFNQASGMVNITRQQGVPGWWINPEDTMPVPPTPETPHPTPGNFQVVNDIRGYYTADNAKRRVSAVNTVKPGNYFVFNTSQGMVNVTSTPSVPGSWINPEDNRGTAQIIPAPRTHTVVKGDTIHAICVQYGLDRSNNYAQFRALNPNSGHYGNWTNIWPGDVVRVR